MMKTNRRILPVLLILLPQRAVPFTIPRIGISLYRHASIQQRQCPSTISSRPTDTTRAGYAPLRISSNGNDLDNENLGSSSPSASTGKDEDTVDDMKEFMAKVSAVAVGGFVLFNIASFALSTTMALTTSAFSALVDEIGREFANLFSFFGSIFMGMLGLFAKLLPAVGKGVVSAGKSAAPYVETAARQVGEVATPVLQDASEQLSKTAAPYVAPMVDAVDSTIKTATDSVGSAVDTTIVSPLREATDSAKEAVGSAIDANVVAPINTAKESVASAVDSSIKSATDSINSAVDANIVSPINAAKDNVVGAVDSSISSAKSSIKSAVDTGVDSAMGAVDGAVKGAARNISDSVKSATDTVSTE